MRIKRRGKILYSLIALMLLAGLVPLVLTTAWIMSSSRDALESSERLLQIDQTRSIAQQSRLYLQSMHNQIAAIAETFEIASNLRAVSQRIASVNSESLLDFVEEEPGVVDLGLRPQSERCLCGLHPRRPHHR